MNQIDTSQIVDPLIEEPWTGPMLKFMQDGNAEALKNICIGMIGSSYSTSVVYILWGCILTGVSVGPGTFSVSAGAIFFNGAIYTLAGPIGGTLSGGQSVFLNIFTSNGAPDPVTFSDGVARNVCNVIQVALTIATTGSLPQPFSAWVSLTTAWNTIGAAGQPAFQNSWSDYSSAVSGYAPAFRLEKFGGVLHIRGLITGAASGTTAFALPTGSPFIPLNSVYKAVSCLGNSVCSVYIQGASDSNPGYVKLYTTGTPTMDLDCLVPML